MHPIIQYFRENLAFKKTSNKIILEYIDVGNHELKKFGDKMHKQLSWIDQGHSEEDFIKWNPQLWTRSPEHDTYGHQSSCKMQWETNITLRYRIWTQLNSYNTEVTKFGHGTMLNYHYFSSIPKWYRPNQIRIWSHSYFIIIHNVRCAYQSTIAHTGVIWRGKRSITIRCSHTTIQERGL